MMMFFFFLAASYPQATNFPLVEGFESLTFPPPGWTTHSTGTGWVNWAPYAHSGEASASHQYAQGMQDGWLISPKIKLPNNLESLLEFWSSNRYVNSHYHNGIWISTTDASVESFTLLKQLTKPDEVSDPWKKIVISLSDYAGEYIYIGFRYMGNDADNWWIDDVSVKLAGIDGAVTRFYSAASPMAEEPFLYKAVIENVGTQPLTGYTVKLMDDANNVLAVSESGPNLSLGATAHINISWTAPAAGTYFLRAVLDMPGDVNPYNNTSSVLEVNIKPNTGSLYEGPIGTGMAMSFLPINFDYRHSRTQSIFFDHEIMGRLGTIFQIQYFNNFVHEIGYIPMQIWLANTTVSSLDTWLPASEFTLVFDGEVYFPIGKNTITIPLDIPYEYTGNNLVVMTNCPSGESSSSNNLFYCTLTEEIWHRSRFYFSDDSEFNWAQTGASGNWHPNMVCSFALEGLGSVSGTVTDGTTPLEGAQVEIVGTNLNRITNNEGNYNFSIVLPGTQQIKASKFGYADATSSVTVVAANNTTADIVLTPLSTYTISGKVTGNDAPGGLQGVTIKLSGYDDYNVVTDAAGNYSISSVYGDFSYNIKAELSGYGTYVSTVEVNANATHNIELIEIPYPVLNPVAKVVGTDAVITWGEPQEIVTFRYDNGICTGQLGFNFNAAPRGVLGACHRANAELRKMSWYLTDIAGEHTAANLFIFDLDAAGQPTNKIIFSALNVPTTVSQWCEYEFPEPISTPNGFFIAMSHETTFLSLGTTTPDNEYPFLPGTNFVTSDYDSVAFSALENAGFKINFMLRAEGYVLGKSAQFGYFAPSAQKTSSLIHNDMTSAQLVFTPSDPVATEPPVSKTKSKSLIGYVIYRLIENDPEPSWTELSTHVTGFSYTDNEWITLPEGRYQYAVKAIYTGNVMSEARLSNVLVKATYPVTYNTSANGTLTVTANGNTVANGTLIDHGTVLTIIATPDPNYKLLTLTVNGNNFANNSMYTVVSATHIECNFEGVGVKENSLSDVIVYSYQNSVYIKNEKNVALKSVEIIDITGRVVYRSVINDVETVVTLQVATGIYNVNLMSQDNTIFTTKILIHN